MIKTFTVIFIVVSLLMLDTRMVVCQESVAAGQGQAAESSTQQPAQSVQNGNSATANRAQTSPAQLDDRARKIKRTVEKIGVAGKLTLYLKNGEDFYGSVVSYDEESLQIAEIDLKQVVTVQYRNVKKVREGYGNPNLFTGKRNNPPKGIRVGVMAALLVFAFLPILVVLSSKD